MVNLEFYGFSLGNIDHLYVYGKRFTSFVVIPVVRIMLIRFDLFNLFAFFTNIFGRLQFNFSL